MMKRKALIVAMSLAALLVLSLVFRTTCTWTYTIDFGFKFPDLNTEQEPPTSLKPRTPHTAYTDDVLSYISKIESQKPRSSSYAYSKDELKFTAMRDFLEDDLYKYDLFGATWDGDKTESFRAYLVDRSDVKTLIQDKEWTTMHYIQSYRTSMGRDEVIAFYDGGVYIPIQGKSQKSPYGTVWVYYLYPLRDCYLSSIDQIETEYNPNNFKAFNYFMELMDYKLTPLEEQIQ